MGVSMPTQMELDKSLLTVKIVWLEQANAFRKNC